LNKPRYKQALRRTDANKLFCDLAPPRLDASYTQGEFYTQGVIR